LNFNEQLERIGEVAVVLLLGGMLSLRLLTPEMAGFVVLMLFVVRPISTGVGLIGTRASRVQRRLIGWFGIRGIGSIYYLMYAIVHHLPAHLSQRLIDLTFAHELLFSTHGIATRPQNQRVGAKHWRTRSHHQPVVSAPMLRP
jgi:NhaP-type Na+/H+ or K+/H+ antiporter